MTKVLGIVLCVLLLIANIPGAVLASGPNDTSLLLAQAVAPTLGDAGGGSCTDLVVKRDSGIVYGYSDAWSAGDQLGIVLTADPADYPLEIISVSCYLYCLPTSSFPGADTQVDLQAHIYAFDGQSPGELLASSAIVRHDLAAIGYQGWVTVPLTSALPLSTGESWVAAVAYHSGNTGQTPPILSDISSDIPGQTCFYYQGQVWTEHYAKWSNPLDIGYSMIRAVVEPAGSATCRLEQAVEADADTLLMSGQPGSNYGAQPWMMVGDYSGSSIGTTRALIHFPAPSLPDPNAVLTRATLRLVNDRAIDQTLPAELTVYDATLAWQEMSATWQGQLGLVGDRQGSAMVATRPIGGTYRKRLLDVDLTAKAQAWLAAPASNYGVVVLGDEQVANSAKYLHSREFSNVDLRPHLILQWEWPEPTPAPTSVPTTDPAQTVKLRLPLVLK